MTTQKTQISRRKAILGGALGGATVLATPAIANAQTRKIVMVTSWPEALAGIGDSAKRFVERVREASAGALDVEISWAGQTVGALAVHEAVGEGVAQMYHSAEYYFARRHPALSFFTVVPMGLTGMEQVSWIKYGGGQQLWDEVNAPFNVKTLPAGGTGTQMGGWFNKPITSLDDFSGLRYRMPGLGGEVLKSLGAKVVGLPGGKIADALFDGEIDATEWVGPYNDQQFGLQKLLSTYMYPGFHEPGTVTCVGFNLDFWKGLSDQERAVFQTCADAENHAQHADYYGNNAYALISLLRESGVRPTKLPDDVWEQLAHKADDVVRDYAKKDALTGRVFESFNAFRTLMNDSTPLSQESYIIKRGLDHVFQ